MSPSKSRHGWHPCSPETYRKLKKLNAALYRAMHLAATWRRWDRKEPQNRIIRKKIRNTLGQVVGYQPPVPMPEPRLCPVFNEKYEEATHWPRSGYSPTKVMETKVRMLREHVAGEFSKARYPVPSPEMVRPVSLSVEEIDRLLDLLK